MHVIQIFIVIGLLLVDPALAQQAELLGLPGGAKGPQISRHGLCDLPCCCARSALPTGASPTSPVFCIHRRKKRVQRRLAYAFYDYYPPGFRQSIRDAQP